MNVGTKSLLFGVHQFIWHPITVWLAWVHLNKSYPRWWECVAIFTHDLGYWGKSDMDGEDGRTHPVAGANLAYNWTYKLGRWCGLNHVAASGRAHRAWTQAIGHSRYYAQANNLKVSTLFFADKCAILFDPKYWYLFRAILSGELEEYISNAPQEVQSRVNWTGAPAWFDWYRAKVIDKFYGPKNH